jgi:uncharacterized protein YdeI (YjbR/CyaY-like superfamily)
MNNTNPDVDVFFGALKKWHNELSKLRAIILECQLKEEVKWRVPCYTYNNGNVVLIHGFKEYCASAFFKGALLKDPKQILIQQTENVQSGRQIRFASLSEIVAQEDIIKAYIYEAIEVDKSGQKVELKKISDFEMPDEFYTKCDESPAFKSAFEALTPGRQRAYSLLFSAAKQAETRVSRIEKYEERILDGKGPQECVCGHSQKPPRCDGSHKHFQ